MAGTDKNLESIYEPVEMLVDSAFSSWIRLNHSFSNVSCIYDFRYIALVLTP